MRNKRDQENNLTNQDASNNSFISKFAKKIGLGSYDRQQSREESAITFSLLKKALWKKTDWTQRAISEIESKEVSRIKARQENILGRDKSMHQLLTDGDSNIGWDDRFMLRTILLADMEFEDFSMQRLHTYLQASDHKYRETSGEVITEESYDFLMRLHRNSNAKGRMGTKPGEYTKVEIGNEYHIYNKQTKVFEKKRATEVVYVRQEYEKYMDQVLEELDTFSTRQLSNVSKEILEYMKIDGRFIELDETWGKDQGKYGPENRTKCAAGDWKDHLGEQFTNNMLDNYCNRMDMHKLDPDQIGMLAKIIAEELKIEQGLSNKPGNKSASVIFSSRDGNCVNKSES